MEFSLIKGFQNYITLGEVMFLYFLSGPLTKKPFSSYTASPKMPGACSMNAATALGTMGKNIDQ